MIARRCGSTGPGITAVVGPNGCGKSNLSDAISWVLGEQSAKSFRGARMEDVIFAGTRERKPLGMAQVTLTMMDPAAQAPIDDLPTNGNGNGHGRNGHPKRRRDHHHSPAVPLGRKRIPDQRQHARLRDIQDLFSGTGLGPESYAIIEQGRIGQILSNKPADRRAIIEEAAGIGKYKTRKRLAEAKLESAQTESLSRVRHPGRSRTAGEFAQAPGIQGQKIRGTAHGNGGAPAQAVSGRFQMLEARSGQLALDLNQAQSAFQTMSAQVQEQEKEHTRLQESCYRTEAS